MPFEDIFVRMPFGLTGCAMQIFQIDAFTDRLFQGNPAAVIPLGAWLPDEQLQRIAAENNLSETAFFVPRSEGGFDLRWCTPTVEVDLCGHATLATTHVLYTQLGYAAPQIVFHTRSGKLTTRRIAENRYELDFPADRLQADPPPPELLEAIGAIPTEVYAGREDWMLVFDRQEQIEALLPDFRLMAQIPSRGVIATAPGREVDFVSRCFFPQSGIDEDPVTGSAHTTMTPYWARRLDKALLTAAQLSTRGGRLECELRGDRVFLRGDCVTYLKGEVFC